MSGHSKWSTIKRQKQASDAARGQLFTKIGNAITIAVRSGGSTDPEGNVRLRLVIDKAKAANMPKSNIERAIERATGIDATGAKLEEVMYEGFGPGGIAVLAEGITDNRQRSAAAIKNVFSAHGGTLGGTGSAAYLFKHVGAIHIQKPSLEADRLLEIVIASGGQDLEEETDRYMIYTKPQDLHTVKSFLEAQKLTVIESELMYIPKTTVTVTDRSLAAKLVQLLAALEAQDDIHKVYANCELPQDQKILPS